MNGGEDYVSDSMEPSANLGARLVDQFFWRWWWYTLPIVLFAVLGVAGVQRLAPEYQSEGTLSASANPLVEQLEVRGGTLNRFEAPAAGLARLINEQLRTNAFLDVVAERSGLAESLASGAVTYGILESQILATAQGENVLEVAARWSDPETAFRLVDATVDTYLEYVESVVVEDSLQAISFWTERRTEAQESRAVAEADLAEYLVDLPVMIEGQELPLDVQLAVNRLNANLDMALDDVRAAQSGIDAANLSAEQARSEAGRQLRLIDPPAVATAASPMRMQQALTLMVYTTIGVLIALAALLTVTLLDRTVRLPSSLRAATSNVAVASVPRYHRRRTRPDRQRSRPDRQRTRPERNRGRPDSHEGVKNSSEAAPPQKREAS